MAGYSKIAFFQPQVAKKCRLPIPIQLIVVIISIIVSHFMKLHDKYGVKVTGPLKEGFPMPSVPPTDLMMKLLTDSIVVGLVGYSITLSLAKKFAEQFRYDLDGNQELLAEVQFKDND